MLEILAKRLVAAEKDLFIELLRRSGGLFLGKDHAPAFRNAGFNI
jgi:hypothetical protein